MLNSRVKSRPHILMQCLCFTQIFTHFVFTRMCLRRLYTIYTNFSRFRDRQSFKKTALTRLLLKLIMTLQNVIVIPRSVVPNDFCYCIIGMAPQFSTAYLYYSVVMHLYIYLIVHYAKTRQCFRD